MDEGSITQKARQLLWINQTAAAPLIKLYLSRLASHFEDRLRNMKSRPCDSEQAAGSGSAASWSQSVASGLSELENREELESLVEDIAVRKVLKAREGNGQFDQGGSEATSLRRVHSESQDSDFLKYALQLEPDEEDAAQLEECLDRIESNLKQEGKHLREVFLLRLKGAERHEIADSLNCSDATVDRKMRRIQEVLHTLLPGLQTASYSP
jgi:DNA-directed RNA polymerase specialized sigma24 family protein